MTVITININRLESLGKSQSLFVWILQKEMFSLQSRFMKQNITMTKTESRSIYTKVLPAMITGW